MKKKIILSLLVFLCFLIETKADDSSEDDCYIPPDEDITVCLSNCGDIDFDFKEGEGCKVEIPQFDKEDEKIPECPEINHDASCDELEYVNTTCYEDKSVACGYATTQLVVTTTISFPSKPQSVYAGHDFIWGELTSQQNVVTNLVDISRYNNEVKGIKAEMSGYQTYIACLKASIEMLKAKIKEIMKEMEPYNACWTQKVDCVIHHVKVNSGCNSDCAYTDEEECGEPYWVANESCMAATHTAISRLESTINSNENSIADSNEILTNLSFKLGVVERCGAEITNYKDYSYTTPDVVKITSSEMELADGYRQKANTITAIEKNNGNPLETKIMGKSVDLPEGILTDVEHNSQFFVPVVTKNGTKGTISLNINDAITYFSGNSYGSDAIYPNVNQFNVAIRFNLYVSQNGSMELNNVNYKDYEKWENIITSSQKSA